MRRSRIERWPTGVLLLLLLTLALLPLGMVLGWVAHQSNQATDTANIDRATQRGEKAAQAIETLIDEKALAMRLAANSALASDRPDPCAIITRTLAGAPGMPTSFRLRDSEGAERCSAGELTPERTSRRVAPGRLDLWISPTGSLYYRTGIDQGSITASIAIAELRATAEAASGRLYELSISDGASDLIILDDPASHVGDPLARTNMYVVNGGQLAVRTTGPISTSTWRDQLSLFLPLLMWVVAALLSWLLVRRLLLNPLARLQRSISEYQPGHNSLQLPERLGPTTEIRELSQSFQRAVDRIEGAEQEAIDAYEGQKKLVREVHHRVKNNLQVVASLLSIHGRNANGQEAQSAYGAIGRRVDALSVVHRHHYAELEENRGISLRPLLTELAAGLRASAPSEARKMIIALEIDPLFTTQDNAVAATFLITEIVEFAMLRYPDQPVEIELRRVDELSANLAISSSVLVPETREEDRAKVQFERIVEGLARQLRSPLDRRLGRYAVTLPIFPPQ
ncbi:sensor histidine kinase [Sphingomonas xanthus]|uniref:histidine kinase n=1 Tax=Sphingomonas xanthus TaxID=2594473 RepID=A0A516IQE4_9SPHN|nr:histidine kinase dimerization/phosphoacceptor domain -containing protein [Sphingomonas xanthus]QDP19140.1 HAMP domain-containing protein [Sphingomonas xanthus]